MSPLEEFGLFFACDNKGESGFGKVSDRAKAKDLRPQGNPGGSVVGCPLNGRLLLGFRSPESALTSVEARTPPKPLSNEFKEQAPRGGRRRRGGEGGGGEEERDIRPFICFLFTFLQQDQI